MKPREPPFFRGDQNEDIHGWISALRDYLYLLGANETQAVAYTATLLQSHARLWWDKFLLERHGKRPETLQEMLQALETRFMSPMYEKDARMKLWTISQRKEESVHGFSSRFQTLLARLPRYDETDMLERYIRALHPHLRMPVAQKEPKTLSECIRVASHLELLSGTYIGKSVSGDSSSAAQRVQVQNQGRGQGKKGSSQQQQQQQQQSQQYQQYQQNSGQGRGRGKKGQGGGRGPQCYRCGAWGHIAPRCPTLAQDQGRGSFQTPRGRGGQSGGRGQAGRGQPARLHALAGEGASSPGQHPAAQPERQPNMQGNA